MTRVRKRRPYTPDDVIKIYKKYGKNITREKAEKVLIYLRNLAKLTVEQHFGPG